MNILDEIVANTRSKLEDKKRKEPIDDLLSKIDMDNLGESIFKRSLEGKSQSIIAEIKKASPSAGLISKNFDPVEKAKEYESFGASALSILTEEDYFQGNVQHLIDVKAVSNLPILRKDFIVDELSLIHI